MTWPVTIGVAAVLVAAAATAQSAKQEAPPLTAAVRQAVQVNKPDAQIDKLISKLSTPKYVYEAELAEGEVEVTPDGKVIKAGK